MERYPDGALWEEVTYLAYHLHWSLDELLDLDHRRRAQLLGLVADHDRRDREQRGSERRTARSTT